MFAIWGHSILPRRKPRELYLKKKPHSMKWTRCFGVNCRQRFSQIYYRARSILVVTFHIVTWHFTVFFKWSYFVTPLLTIRFQVMSPTALWSCSFSNLQSCRRRVGQQRQLAPVVWTLLLKIQFVRSIEGHSSSRPASVNIREVRNRFCTVFARLSSSIDFDSTKATAKD